MGYIMTKDGWKQLIPLSDPVLCGYAYPNAREASNEDGRYRGTFVEYNGVRMTPAARSFVRQLESEVNELRGGRIERRGHELLEHGYEDRRRRDKYGVPYLA